MSAVLDDGRRSAGAAPLRVALLGCGVVGSEVARMLLTQSDELTARVGARLELIGIAVRRSGREREGIDPALFTTDALGLVRQADLVIEVIGGIEPAREYILEAMRHGASVVTANKALLAEDGPTLYDCADDNGVDLYFEAAVAGAIPLVRPVKESLAGDNITRVLGIVNGTTNYVLDQMDSTGMGFAEAVEQAQSLGYAEADPRPTSKASTQRPRRRFSPLLPSTPGSVRATCIARASRGSAPPMWPLLVSRVTW